MGVLLFDLYGLFMQLQTPQGRQKVEQAFNLNAQNVSTAEFWHSYRALRHNLDAGIWDYAHYLQVLQQELGAHAPVSVTDFLQADAFSCSQNVPEMVQWLNELTTAGTKVALLSNIPTQLLALIKQSQPWLAQFTPSFFSCEIGLAKPDPAIYEYVTKKLAVNKSEILFFDDTLENTLSAKEYGWQVHHFTDISRAKKTVTAFLASEIDADDQGNKIHG